MEQHVIPVHRAPSNPLLVMVLAHHAQLAPLVLPSISNAQQVSAWSIRHVQHVHSGHSNQVLVTHLVRHAQKTQNPARVVDLNASVATPKPKLNVSFQVVTSLE